MRRYMNSPRSICLLIAQFLFLAVSVTALAQPATSAGEPTPQQQMDQMMRDIHCQMLSRWTNQLDELAALLKGLSLGTEEQKQVDAVVAETRQTYQAALAAAQAGEMPTREQMEEFGVRRGSMEGRINHLLGPQRAQRLQRMLHSPRREGRQLVEALRTNLGSLKLTERQKAVVEPVVAQALAKFDKMASEAPGDPQAMASAKDEFIGIVRQAGRELLPILDANQRAELLELMPILAEVPR